MLSAEALINDEDENVPNLLLQKKRPLQKCPMFYDCKYDRSAHKMITI